MPGLIALITKERNQPLPPGALDAIQSRLVPAPNQQAKEAVLGPGARLRIVHNDQSRYGFLESPHWCLAWYGDPEAQGQPIGRELWPKIQADLADRGVGPWLSTLTGHFQLFLYSRNDHRSYAVTDKVAIFPWYCAETAGFFAFAPEALAFRALKQFGWEGRIKQRAIFEFMAASMLWGDDTYWERAQRIGPGRYIELHDGHQQKHLYWQMISRPSPQPLAELIDELHRAVHASLAKLPPGNLFVSLSGGLDSRALMGFLLESGRKFETISYDLGDKGTTDDTNLGAYYAAIAGVKHHIYRLPKDPPAASLLANMETLIQASGGEDEISTSQQSFCYPGFFDYLEGKSEIMLFGHEMWGWGSHAPSTEVAFWDCMLYNLNQFAQPAAILPPPVYLAACADLEDRRRELMAEYGSVITDPFDLKEYLTWIAKESRYVLHSDYIHHCHYLAKTPFLGDEVLEVILRIPSRWKRKKFIFKQMCLQKFPHLFRDQKTPSSYISGKNQIELVLQNEKFRRLLRSRLQDEMPQTLRDILDQGAFATWLDKVVLDTPKGATTQKMQYNAKWFINNLARKWPWFHGHLRSYLLRRGRLQFPVVDSNFVFRMFILSSAIRQYESD